jgi:hypothetical protein
MRFASMTSNGGNYAAAGKAVADSAAKTFAVQRKTGPDYGKLSQVAMKTAAEERISATQASAKVTNAGIDAYSNVTNTGQKVAVFNKKEELKNNMRKAGGIAALGKMAGAGYLAATDNTKGRERPTADLKGLVESSKAKRTALKEKQTAESDALGTYKATPFKPSGGATPGKATSADGSLTSSAQALDAGKGSAGSGNKYNLQQMTDYAVQGGFSPTNARTMAAISMGESGGNAGIDTVQSGLDPNKSNEYSVGLSQINVQAHGDKLTRRGWTEADLRDPVKNMTIAKEVYDEVGSFKPWSVYQKGLHQQYLN